MVAPLDEWMVQKGGWSKDEPVLSLCGGRRGLMLMVMVVRKGCVLLALILFGVARLDVKDDEGRRPREDKGRTNSPRIGTVK